MPSSKSYDLPSHCRMSLSASLCEHHWRLRSWRSFLYRQLYWTTPTAAVACPPPMAYAACPARLRSVQGKECGLHYGCEAAVEPGDDRRHSFQDFATSPAPTAMRSTHQSESRSFSESSATAWTCQISAPGLALSIVQSSGEMSSSGMLAGIPAACQLSTARASSPSSCASRAAASPLVSPFSTPPLGTVRWK